MNGIEEARVLTSSSWTIKSVPQSLMPFIMLTMVDSPVMPVSPAVFNNILSTWSYRARGWSWGMFGIKLSNENRAPSTCKSVVWLCCVPVALGPHMANHSVRDRGALEQRRSKGAWPARWYCKWRESRNAINDPNPLSGSLSLT